MSTNDEGAGNGNANGAPPAPAMPRPGSVLRVTVPFKTWKQAERFAQARTLNSLEELLAAFVGDVVRAQARPGSWEAERVGGWIERRYPPVEWLRRLRAAREREEAEADDARHAGRVARLAGRGRGRGKGGA